MNYKVLTEDKDPMGAAISDYFIKGKAGRLSVFSSQFDEDEIPVKDLFRTYGEMSPVEQEALQIAQGRILDVGAGSGCHSLALKEMGKESFAIDISPLSVAVMRERGIEAENANFFDLSFSSRFDTILMLMNGSGIIGRLQNIGEFFKRARTLLNPGGCIIMDSSDLKYLFEDEDGNFDIDAADGYYGEVDFSMRYKNINGESFDWLYIDYDTLSLHAAQYGFKAELLKKGEHYDYLAKLVEM